MVFGYNGLGRLGIHLAGALTPVQAGIPGADGWDKLFNHRVGPEIGWLYPLVLLGLAGAVALWARKERGPSAAGFVMWLAWLLTIGLVFSGMGALPHTAYLGALAPPIAALSATGITLAWRWRGEPSWRSLLLPLAIAGELTWSYYLWDSYDSFLHPILWAAVALAGLALVMIAIARLHPQLGSRVLTSGAAVGIVAMLAAPAAWSASVLDPRYGGQPYDATAGPAGSYGVTRGLDISAVPFRTREALRLPRRPRRTTRRTSWRRSHGTLPRRTSLRRGARCYRWADTPGRPPRQPSLACSTWSAPDRSVT